jgi:hypothetical protein
MTISLLTAHPSPEMLVDLVRLERKDCVFGSDPDNHAKGKPWEERPLRVAVLPKA